MLKITELAYTGYPVTDVPRARNFYESALAAVRGAGAPIHYGPLETPVCRLFGGSDPDGNGIIFHQRKT